jgi:hypothetical protein
VIKNRPCGACAALVPADSGCDHWKPKTRAAHQARRNGRQSAADRKVVNDFRKTMGEK